MYVCVYDYVTRRHDARTLRRQPKYLLLRLSHSSKRLNANSQQKQLQVMFLKKITYFLCPMILEKILRQFMNYMSKNL